MSETTLMQVWMRFGRPGPAPVASPGRERSSLPGRGRGGPDGHRRNNRRPNRSESFSVQRRFS